MRSHIRSPARPTARSPPRSLATHRKRQPQRSRLGAGDEGLEGRVRARYPNTDWPDEVAEAGEACFFPSGHVLIYETASKVMELNPASALQSCMDLTEQSIKRMMAGATAPA